MSGQPLTVKNETKSSSQLCPGSALLIKLSYFSANIKSTEVSTIASRMDYAQTATLT
jgi:hypothetical protein